ncbi:uncharacterized protein LOC125500930 [Athalia rosae]|uniref:uncharacterized protein LOC125500930 n=1 Tax=Athalia rosae TaxID=37344 RepID=UPI0020336A68|nr:uncharacterized protein LOC125500930 [Athalia rosae]
MNMNRNSNNDNGAKALHQRNIQSGDEATDTGPQRLTSPTERAQPSCEGARPAKGQSFFIRYKDIPFAGRGDPEEPQTTEQCAPQNVVASTSQHQDAAENLKKQLDGGKETAEKLRSLGREIMKTYAASGNLKRQLREAADFKIAEAGYRLKGGVDPKVFTEWEQEVEVAVSEITSSNRFSTQRADEMAELLNRSKRLINELLLERRLKKSRAAVEPETSARTQNTAGGEVIDIDTDTEDEKQEWGVAPRQRGKKKRKRQQRSAEAHCTSLTETTPPAKRHPDVDAEPNIANAQPIPRIDMATNKGDEHNAENDTNTTGANTEKGNGKDKNKTGKEKPTLRVRANKDETYPVLFKEIKTNIETKDLQVLEVRKTAANSDVLMRMPSMDQAEVILKRLRDAGRTADILGPKRTRLHLRNLHNPTTEEEICEAVEKAARAETKLVRNNMPRAAAVTVNEAVAVIVQFRSYFESEELPIWSSSVWKEMSAALGGKWPRDCVYTNVTKNRRKILDLAWKKMDIIILKTQDHNNYCSLDETSLSKAWMFLTYY